MGWDVRGLHRTGYLRGRATKSFRSLPTHGGREQTSSRDPAAPARAFRFHGSGSTSPLIIIASVAHCYGVHALLSTSKHLHCSSLLITLSLGLC
jgi:hypothetical protein